MYKLTEESHVGSINDTNVRINDADGRLNRFLADKKTTILSELKGKPQSIVEQLVSVLNIPERTIYRDIEWLRENDQGWYISE